MRKMLDPSQNRHAGAIFAVCVLCGPIAIVVGCIAWWNAHTKQPLPPDTYIRLNTVANQVELFADQVVRLSLAGNGTRGADGKPSRDEQTLASMVVDPRGVELSTSPWNVTSTQVNSIKRVAEERDSAEWEVEILVGYSAPGSGSVRFSTTIVTVLSSAGSYKAAALPRLQDFKHPPMQVGPGYTHAVDLRSALGKAVSDFSSAYYVPAGSGDGQMGRLVTGDFPERPVMSSPFTSTSVTMLVAKSAPPNEPTPGDSIDVLATVRGNASGDTWYTMQLPLRLQFTDQQQWAVSDILQTVDVGQITHQ